MILINWNLPSVKPVKQIFLSLQILIMLTYYAAQLGIALSAVDSKDNNKPLGVMQWSDSKSTLQ